MDNYNICGVMVQARANELDRVKHTLLQTDGVEIHANSDDGKLVVTVESDSRYYIADTISSFTDIEGVLAASMIYQYSDDMATSEGVSA